MPKYRPGGSGSPHNRLQKRREFGRAERKNKSCFNQPQVNPSRKEPSEQKRSRKQETEPVDWIRAILICAIVFLTAFVMVERIFIKDDMLFSFVSSTFNLVAVYYFGKTKEVRSPSSEDAL